MSNFITNLLLIKDQNITMEDKLDLINVAGQDTFVFHGALSYEPKCCTNCGCMKEGKLLYKRRKETIERSFADSKQNHGYRYARYRGKAKVQSYAWLSCCVQNMKTIALREV